MADDVKRIIEDLLRESASVKLAMVQECAPTIAQIARVTIDCFQAGGKLLLCGNGGSAADAQHIAAEFVAKFRAKRPALPAIALTTNTSTLTAVGNDWSFADIFARQVEALGRKGDVLFAFSTSGESENVLQAVQRAGGLEIVTVGFGGAGETRLHSSVDVCLRIPSRDTPRIQEGHIVAGHVICELIELAMSGKDR